MSLSNEEEILQSLDEIKTNDEAFHVIVDLVNTYKGKQLAEKLKEHFDEVNVSDQKHILRVEKHALDFVKDYRNKTYSAQLRAERKCLFETLYTKDENSLKCNECGENFKGKSHMNKHIRTTHKSNEIEEQISNDTALLQYRDSPFFWTGIRTKAAEEQKQRSADEETLLNQLKRKDDRIAHLESQIKAQSDANQKFSPDSEIVVIKRTSSIQGSNALHCTRYTPNNRVRGNYVVKDALFTPIPAPNTKRRKISGDDDNDNSEQIRNWKRRSRIVKNLDSVTNELIGRDNNESTPDQNSKNRIITSQIKQQGAENVNKIVTPDLMKDVTSLTNTEAASLITECQLSQSQVRQIIRAQNNKGCSKLLKNEKAIHQARSEMTKGLDGDLYHAVKLQLQTKRQGEEVNRLEFRPAVYAKSVKALISKIIEIEAPDQNFQVLPDGTKKCIVGIAMDSGGGSTKCQIALMQDRHERIKDHMLFIFEASDTKHNTNKIFAQGIEEGLHEVADKVLEVDGELYLIEFGGVFDLKVR